MIGGIEAGALGRHFRDRSDHAYWRGLVQHQRKERRDREQRAELDERAAELLDVMLVMATSEAIAEFRIRLDAYDTATVAALQKNERDLTHVREEIDHMLLRAHVLADGRRVFLTEDGRKVFDEHGQRIHETQIAPEAIDPRRPRWELFSAAKEREARVLMERGEIHAYQAKLDAARLHSDRSDFSQNDLEALSDDLEASMPQAVRDELHSQPRERKLRFDPGATLSRSPADAISQPRPMLSF